MADTPPTPKVKGKLPKWAIPVGIAGTLGVVIVLRKRKTTGKATEPGAEGLTNQSFIPVTGENVAGVGAPYGSSGESNNQSSLINFLKEQNQEQVTRRGEERVETRESLEREQNFYQQLLTNLGTGGGSPNSNGAPGTTTAPPAPAQGPPSPPPVGPAPPEPVWGGPPTKPPAPSCGPGWNWNPADGAPGPHSCWKYSRDRCPPPRIFKHVYQDGHVVCAST